MIYFKSIFTIFKVFEHSGISIDKQIISFFILILRVYNNFSVLIQKSDEAIMFKSIGVFSRFKYSLISGAFNFGSVKMKESE